MAFVNCSRQRAVRSVLVALISATICARCVCWPLLHHCKCSYAWYPLRNCHLQLKWWVCAQLSILLGIVLLCRFWEASLDWHENLFGIKACLLSVMNAKHTWLIVWGLSVRHICNERLRNRCIFSLTFKRIVYEVFHFHKSSCNAIIKTTSMRAWRTVQRAFVCFLYHHETLL